MLVLIRVDSGLLIMIPDALIVHLYQNSTLNALLKVHLWIEYYGKMVGCNSFQFKFRVVLFQRRAMTENVQGVQGQIDILWTGFTVGWVDFWDVLWCLLCSPHYDILFSALLFQKKVQRGAQI